MSLIDVDDVLAARTRIAPYVRKTPLIAASSLAVRPTEAELWLKLECLQVTGSFKARGAANRLLTEAPERLKRGIVTASGGNHGLGVARAAALADTRSTIFVPSAVSEEKIRKLEAWGAMVERVDGIWDDANNAAKAFVAETGAIYFHPFADAAVVAGQGTVALEILVDLPAFDSIVIAIGGGGLIAGMATAIKALRPEVKIFGVEPVGSPTLHDSLRAGEVVTLGGITTRVPTMACARTDDAVFEIVRNAVDEIVLVEDDEMAAAARWLWFELGIAADLSGAAAVAAMQTGRLTFDAGERVCALVCGAGLAMNEG